MPNLDRFFEGCEILPYVWRNAQKDSKIEPTEVAEYSAIEQAVCIWWLVIISHYIGKLSIYKLALRT